MFRTHTALDINKGVLVSIQKPGKEKGPLKNQRPITLLTTMRKLLSILTLNRIREATERHISQTQSGFRPNRSTADVVWTHRWLAAKANLVKENFFITGVDMSAAFDTINRQTLLGIIKSFLQEDEIRIIRFLLSNTTLEPKIKGATQQRNFTSNIGTPQGDSLSPVLFTIYLEEALKEVRKVLPQETKPCEVAYADDVDFVDNKSFANIDLIDPIMTKYNLKLNKDKTEHTKIQREEERSDEVWRKTKKVGSLIGDKEDVDRRKILSTAAMNKLNHIWK